MEFIHLIIFASERYSYKGASNSKMTILGDFLSSDVGCGVSSRKKPTYQDWALDDSLGMGLSGNLTFIEKENNFILLSDLYEEGEPEELQMTRQQFVKLLDDWQEKVCKLKPKEVTITYDNDEFVIETKD